MKYCHDCIEPYVDGEQCPRCGKPLLDERPRPDAAMRLKPAPSCLVWILGPVLIASGVAYGTWVTGPEVGLVTFILLALGLGSFGFGVWTMKSIVVDEQGVAVGRRRVYWEQVEDVLFFRQRIVGRVSRWESSTMGEADKAELICSTGGTFTVNLLLTSVVDAEKVFPAIMRWRSYQRLREREKSLGE